ncbi:MAG TPA: hypothetical protein VGF36_01500 [Rhodopila sp.]
MKRLRKPHGYNRIQGGPEGLVEENTVRCQHCQKIGFVQPGWNTVLWPQISPVPLDFYTCRQCHDAICPSCANKPCRHFEKWLEQVEAQNGLRRINLERMEERAYQCQHHLPTKIS